MRSLVLSLIVAAGCTAPPSVPNHSTLDMPKACSCAGNFSCCTHDETGVVCCTPERCCCRQVTSR